MPSGLGAPGSCWAHAVKACLPGSAPFTTWRRWPRARRRPAPRGPRRIRDGLRSDNGGVAVSVAQLVAVAPVHLVREAQAAVQLYRRVGGVGIDNDGPRATGVRVAQCLAEQVSRDAAVAEGHAG